MLQRTQGGEGTISDKNLPSAAASRLAAATRLAVAVSSPGRIAVAAATAVGPDRNHTSAGQVISNVRFNTLPIMRTFLPSAQTS